MTQSRRTERAIDPHRLKRLAMVEQLAAARGVQDVRVLEALREVPRHLFVEEALAAKVHGDYSLPIGFGQTISQPYIVARMTELLEVNAAHRVLEVGTGSGYQTAVLARLARHVYSVERLAPLGAIARRNLRQARVLNVSLKMDDGTLGWEDRAPFDRILVTAGSPAVPEALVRQLGEEGRLVVPTGGEEAQRILLVRRLADGSIVTSDEGSCSFVKLVGQHGWKR